MTENVGTEGPVAVPPRHQELVETVSRQFAKAGPVSGEGDPANRAARQRAADARAAFSASDMEPVRPEVVQQIKQSLEQVWASHGRTEYLKGILFESNHSNWRASEIGAALASFDAEGVKLVLTKEQAASAK